MTANGISRDRTQGFWVVRVVGEYGVEFAREDADSWVVVDPWRPERKVDLGQVWRKYRIRPVVAWVQNRAGYVSPRVLPPDFQVERLETAPACLRETLAPTIGLPAGMFMYRYFVDAIVYRLRALALAYARQAKVYPYCHAGDPEVGRVGRTTVAGAEEIAFEVEALITCAIRFVEALRFPYWDRFGDGGPAPNGWAETLKATPDSPSSVRDLLKAAWERLQPLNEYRNYIEHVAPVQGLDPTSEVQWLDDIGAGAAFWLPDNPRVKVGKQARFEDRIDALSYCWAKVTDVVDVARDLLLQVYARWPNDRHEAPETSRG